MFTEECAYLAAVVDDLSDYLLSNTASWRLTGPDSQPPLTPGYILLFLKRLDGLSPACREYGEIRIAREKIDIIRLRWNSAWQKRVEAEIPQRLRLWSSYLDSLFEEDSQAHKEYCWKVRWRVMLTLLGAEIENVDQKFVQWLGLLDERLQMISTPGLFVWEEGLEGIFNRFDFWYLYLKIP